MGDSPDSQPKGQAGGGSSSKQKSQASAPATSHGQEPHASQMSKQSFENLLRESLTPMMEMILGVAQKVESIETRIGTSRSVSFQNQPPMHAAEEFSDGAAFNFVREDDGRRGSDRRQSGRNSLGSAASASSHGGADAGTKLERPKFIVAKTYTKDGVRVEVVEDSDYLNFLDDWEHYIKQWMALPVNDGLLYPNEDKIPVISIPTVYARKMAQRIHWLFDLKDTKFSSKKSVKEAKFWEDLDSSTLRLEIGNLVEKEMSSQGMLDAIRRVRWNSSFGIIDIKAFANFQHDFKKTVLRLEAGGVVKIEEIHLKDILIEALPDRKLQGDLTAKFGKSGVIIGNPEDFAINSIFDHVEHHIQSITKLSLAGVVNRQNRDREAAFAGRKVLQSVEVDEPVDLFEDELEEQFQEKVNMALRDPKPCRYVGLGSDGKLMCKWLAGEKQSCNFKHPDSDLKQKGKGTSRDVTMSQSLHTRKVNMSLESSAFEADSFDEGL